MATRRRVISAPPSGQGAGSDCLPQRGRAASANARAAQPRPRPKRPRRAPWGADGRSGSDGSGSGRTARGSVLSGTTARPGRRDIRVFAIRVLRVPRRRPPHAGRRRCGVRAMNQPGRGEGRVAQEADRAVAQPATTMLAAPGTADRPGRAARVVRPAAGDCLVAGGAPLGCTMHRGSDPARAFRAFLSQRGRPTHPDAAGPRIAGTRRSFGADGAALALAGLAKAMRATTFPA